MRGRLDNLMASVQLDADRAWRDLSRPLNPSLAALDAADRRRGPHRKP